MRLAKYLAHSGVASRRRAEELIAAGRVSVGGERVTDPARDVDESSGVTVGGRPVAPEPHEVWVLNKPAGVVSTARSRAAAGRWSSWSSRRGASTPWVGSTRTPRA